MKFRAFTILSAASLLLCAATWVLWVRSYWAIDLFRFGHPAIGFWDVATNRGRVQVFCIPSAPLNHGFVWRVEPLERPGTRFGCDPAIQWDMYFDYIFEHRFGLAIYKGVAQAWITKERLEPSSGMLPARSAIVPIWGVTALLMLPWMIRLPSMVWRRVQRHRRRYRSLCPACGYDLRATPGRCPECGAGPASR